MKKLFALMFVLSLILPSISAKLYAEDIADNEMRNQIAQTVDGVITDNIKSNAKHSNDYDMAGDFVYIIFFNQEITTEGGKYLSNPAKDCVAVAIDDAWAVASKKCVLSKGDKVSPLPGKVDSVSTSNFRILINGRTYPVASYNTGNLILLRAVNENGNPLFSLDFKPKLAYTNHIQVEAHIVDTFKEDTFEVNRTDKHTAAYDSQHDAYEDNFHAYYDVGRTSYPKTIKSYTRDQRTDKTFARISTSWIAGKELRAGDPLFYVKNGRRYLLGFGYAVNLWDNFSGTRTDKVHILDFDDIRDIKAKIYSIDQAAYNRINQNILSLD